MSALEYLGNPPYRLRPPARPFSPAVRAGDFVYVSGQVPGDEKGEIVQGGIEVQTRQVMKNIQAALALAGCTLDDVCKTTVWLQDARDFGSFNRVYMSYFQRQAGPLDHRSAPDGRCAGGDRRGGLQAQGLRSTQAP
jgi:reactive intermediate/imine deaminase